MKPKTFRVSYNGGLFHIQTETSISSTQETYTRWEAEALWQLLGEGLGK